MKYLVVLSVIILVLSGCKKESLSEKDAETIEKEIQAEKDEETIQDYLSSHPEVEATRFDAGIYYQIIVEGTGESPTKASSVTVKYKGYLTNGHVFDETKGDKTFTSKLTDVISGWQIGVPLLKKGGKGLFIFPSELGYGGRDIASIPANSVLIFEIELLDF